MKAFAWDHKAKRYAPIPHHLMETISAEENLKGFAHKYWHHMSGEEPDIGEIIHQRFPQCFVKCGPKYSAAFIYIGDLPLRTRLQLKLISTVYYSRIIGNTVHATAIIFTIIMMTGTVAFAGWLIIESFRWLIGI
jgi:hypothetical protein